MVVLQSPGCLSLFSIFFFSPKPEGIEQEKTFNSMTCASGKSPSSQSLWEHHLTRVYSASYHACSYMLSPIIFRMFHSIWHNTEYFFMCFSQIGTLRPRHWVNTACGYRRLILGLAWFSFRLTTTTQWLLINKPGGRSLENNRTQ